MKTVQKEVFLNLESVEFSSVGCAMNSNHQNEFKYTFTSRKEIQNPENLTIFTEVEEPETLKEWIELNGMPKKLLVEWLNNNFNK